MKIIILEHEPYQERKKQHYFIDNFLKKNIDIEYWGLHKILPYTAKVSYLYEDKDVFVKYFDTMSFFFQELGHLNPKEACFFVEIQFNFSTKEIFKLIFENNFRWFRLDYYRNPSISLESAISFADKIKTLLFNKRLYHKIYEKVRDSVFLESKYGLPDILFYTGNEKKYLSKAKNYVSLDYFDVLTFQEKVKEAPLLNYPYILFLDMMLANHPDFARCGQKEIMEGDLYFKMLNDVFQKLENKYGIPVVIASHPKAKYTNEFGDRLLIQHKTAELAINADIILTHNSLSIIFGVLAKKPIFFINLEKLFSKNFFIKRIQAGIFFMAKSLNAFVVDEVSSMEIISKKNVDEKAYERYLQLYYLKEGNDNLSNFEIVEKNMKELMNEN